MAISIDLPPFAEIMPSAPYREFHQRTVAAPIAEVWSHCLDVTTAEIRVLGPLLSIRGIPARLSSKRAPKTSAPTPVLDTFTSEGFVMLRRDTAPHDGRASIILGAAGQFWSLRGNAPVKFDYPSDLLEFAKPGFAKTVARLDAIDNGDGTTRIETETLVIGTDDASTRKFGPYWKVIRLPSGAIRRSWLAAIDRRATR